MEFLADSIGLLDIYETGRSAHAHDVSSTNPSTNGGQGPQNERTPSTSSSSLQRKQECNICSQKAFNLALENLSDMESCCRCDCQRLEDCDLDIEDNNLEVDQIDSGDIAHSATVSRTKCTEEEEIDASNNNSSSTTQLSRLVTQRIDARTNYNCFTGSVDALTGEIIHGKLVYKVTGEVYEGPFLSVPRQHNHTPPPPTHAYIDQFKNDHNTIINTTQTFETVSLRHGSNATSHFPNGMQFTGTYELDRPKFGKWICKDNEGNVEWMYDGPLIVVGLDDDIRDANTSLSGVAATNSLSHPPGKSSRISSLTSIINANNTPINSAPSSGSVATSVALSTRVIGTSTPLPGSVVFHGNGTFTRYSDGMRYKGEFYKGLAHGVGKEITPNNNLEWSEGENDSGMSIYQGEFLNGLRHGVGTIIEDVIDNDNEYDEGDNSDYCEQCNGNNVNTRADANGPDFAAGGSFSDENDSDESATRRRSQSALSFSPQTISTPCKGCGEYIQTSSPQQPKQRRQRYSSGVWCAGQFEVQRVVGTVRHSSDGSKEFVEDKSPSSDIIMSPASGNGTTWDMLPEKWLGLG